MMNFIIYISLFVIMGCSYSPQIIDKEKFDAIAKKRLVLGVFILVLLINFKISVMAEDEIKNFKNQTEIVKQKNIKRFKNFKVKEYQKLAKKGCTSYLQELVNFYLYKQDLNKAFYWMDKGFDEHYIITNGLSSLYTDTNDFVFYVMNTKPDKINIPDFPKNYVKAYSILDSRPSDFKTPKPIRDLEFLKNRMTKQEIEEAKILTSKILNKNNPTENCHD